MSMSYMAALPVQMQPLQKPEQAWSHGARPEHAAQFDVLQDVHQQRERSYEDEEVLSALVSFIEECRVPPTSYTRPVSCDCPFYFTLKQAPIWNHSCTGHMELIHQRPTREDWKQHVRARHAPLLKEVSGEWRWSAAAAGAFLRGPLGLKLSFSPFR